MGLEIIIWNVNHGNAASIRLPNGRVIMIDCGRNPETNFSPVHRTMSLWNKSQLDYLIITHPHLDHIRDIFMVERFRPRILLRPRISSYRLLNETSGHDRTIIETYLSLQGNYNNYNLSAENDPENFIWSGDVNIRSFLLSTEQSDINDNSVVTFINYQGFCFASAGDMSTIGWEKLIHEQGADFTQMLRRVNFFEASHHGRKEGFNTVIFDYMQPYLVMVSDKLEQDTSAVDRYINYCKGWDVLNEPAGSFMASRKVLTTRHDGRIKLDVNLDGSQTTVNVGVL